MYMDGIYGGSMMFINHYHYIFLLFKLLLLEIVMNGYYVKKF